MDKFEKINITSISKNKKDINEEDNKLYEIIEPEPKKVLNINLPYIESNPVQKTLFQNMNIFVDIYNNGINQSDCVIPILKENGATICKKINKFTNYIIFKDGTKKVIQKALDNEVKLINPLWIHDSTTQNILFKPENYQIKKTYTELLLGENRKRKYNETVMNTTKSMETPKRKKLKTTSENKHHPVLNINTENKIQSQQVTYKKELKIESLDLNQSSDDKNIETNLEKKVLEESNQNLNFSVFGNNLRIFKQEIEDKKNNLFPQNLRNNFFMNGMGSSKINQTSIKPRYDYPNFTPINKNKTKRNLNFDKEKENKVKNLSISKSRENLEIISTICKINILQTNTDSTTLENTNNNINSKIFKLGNNLNNLNNTNSTIIQNTNFIKTLKTNLDKQLKENEKEKMNVQSLRKSKSKSLIKRINHTTSKFEMRKLLLINSPNEDELKYNKNLALESIKMALNDERFTNTSNFPNNIQINPNPFENSNFKLASIDLNETCKNKIKTVIKNLLPDFNKTKSESKSKNNSNVYTGENYSDLEISEYIVIKQTSAVNFNKDLRILYVSFLNYKIINSETNIERKFLRYNYFIESEKKTRLLPLDGFIIKFSIDFESIEKMRLEDKLPFKGYKIFLHNNFYNFYDKVEVGAIDYPLDEMKHEIFIKIICLLGGSVVNNIRLCDICVINKIESHQYFPPHVKNVNQDFIYETLSCLKLPELESFKFKPKEGKNKKNRK